MDHNEQLGSFYCAEPQFQPFGVRLIIRSDIASTTSRNAQAATSLQAHLKIYAHIPLKQSQVYQVVPGIWNTNSDPTDDAGVSDEYIPFAIPACASCSNFSTVSTSIMTECHENPCSQIACARGTPSWNVLQSDRISPKFQRFVTGQPANMTQLSF